MQWNDFTATLGYQEHRRLALAIGGALTEVRKASQITTTNGEAVAAREHVYTALEYLLVAARILRMRPLNEPASHPTSSRGDGDA